jgi:CheY-like chemotaxis protein
MALARILVIEDNLAEVFLLRHAFKEYAREVELEIVADGERAIEFVRGMRSNPTEVQPCVILLDLHLPKHGGLEVLTLIREEPNLRNTRVVVTTNLASPLEERELRGMGAEWRLKPRGLPEYAFLAAELMAICKGFEVAA